MISAFLDFSKASPMSTLLPPPLFSVKVFRIVAASKLIHSFEHQYIFFSMRIQRERASKESFWDLQLLIFTLVSQFYQTQISIKRLVFGLFKSRVCGKLQTYKWRLLHLYQRSLDTQTKISNKYFSNF